jgi:hypothetical protein
MIACTVTTAPRKECTLIECLESLELAGLEPVVFAEPGSTKTDRPTVQNENRLGVWFNWLQSARWALESGADTIYMFQDDMITHPESVDLINSITWPKDAGYVSLYTPKHYQFTKTRELRKKMYTIKTGSMWGATAMVFKRDVLKQLIDHPKCMDWCGCKPRTNPEGYKERRRAQPWTIQNSDYIIGLVLQMYLRYKLYYFNPSPSYHCSRYSAIGHGGNSGRRNAYYIAYQDQPLHPQIFGKSYNFERNPDETTLRIE